jgi:hypothetical protein
MQAMPASLSTPAAQQKAANMSLFCKLVVVYLLTYIFEGAVRFGLSKAHLSSLLYLRDLLPVSATLGMLVAWMADRYRPSALLVVICILMFHFFIGFFFLGRLFQQLFGLKILMPLLLGLSAGYVGLMTEQRARTFATWVIVLSVAGIAINYKVPYPWEGADFETVFGTNTQSKFWTSDGVRRLGGLARASYDAASILLCAGVIVAATYRGVFWRAVLMALAVAGIILTTSKGAVLAMLALGGALLLSQGGKRLGVLRFCVLACTFAAVAAPLLSFVVDVHMRQLSSGLAWSLSSYVDRMENTWPAAFKLLKEHGNFIVGRGIGGVGTAQQYGEGRLYSPADNIFVYWTLACGMLGWVYGGAILLKLLHWDSHALSQRLMVYGFFVVIMTYGVSTNLMEQPVVSFGLGYVIAVMFRARAQAPGGVGLTANNE